MENDVLICETGNGGDAKIEGNDLVLTGGIHNHVYIGLYGGNIEQNTVHVGDEDTLENAEKFDWWGNNLFYPNDPEVQFNSSLERSLVEVALNSSGRLTLEERVSIDLDFMKDFAEVTPEVSVIGIDKAKILVTLQQPGNEENKTFIFIWDNTKLEDTCDSCKDAGKILGLGAFSDGFDEGFVI